MSTSIPTATRSRVPEGVRAGGQFAAELQPEPTLTRRNSRLGAFDGILTDESVAELDSSAKSASRFWVSRKEVRAGAAGFSQDVSDISQETALRVLMSLQKMGEAPDNLRSYTMTTSKRATADANPNGRNWEVNSANAILNLWKENFKASAHRDPTSVEIDEEAEKMCAEWPDQNHKPPRDFHRRPSVVAINLDESAVANLAAKSFPGSDIVDDSVEEDSAMGIALTASINGERKDMIKMRQVAWNAFAEAREDLPAMVPKSVNPRRAANIRKSVTEAGGVLAVCKSWSEDGDSEATAALFAPFGTVGFEEQEHIVDFLTSRHVAGFTNGAETLWDHALTGSTNRKRASDEG
jgi:hypothetical protein